MKLLSLLLTAILCATASAQTIKTLGYNSTNGVVVASTGTNVLTFTNNKTKFSGGDITIEAPGIWWAATANGINLEEMYLSWEGQEKLRWQEENIQINVPLTFSGTNTASTTRANLGFSTNLNTLWTATNAATARTNIGLPLAALTNTSNVTMMRALAGTTNTNHPFSGTISFQDFSDNTHTVTVSNGVITSYTGP